MDDGAPSAISYCSTASATSCAGTTKARKTRSSTKKRKVGFLRDLRGPSCLRGLQLFQNRYAALTTTVRGGRIADGDRNCVSVCLVPVDGSRNEVAGVNDRTCHTQFELVRLSKSSVASS